MIVGGVLQPGYLDLCGREKCSEIIGRGPCFLFRWPLWFAIAPVRELALVPDRIAVSIAPLPDDAADVHRIPGVIDAVLYDDADGHHAAPALVPRFKIHRLG